MANYGPIGAGRTGPYWRRQLGITLPGERSGPELRAYNLQAAKLGLLPQGGPGPGLAAAPAPAYGIPEGPPPGLAASPAAGLDPRLLALIAAFRGQQTRRRPASAPPRFAMPIGTNPPRVPSTHPVLGVIPRPQVGSTGMGPASHDSLRRLVTHYQSQRTARPAY